MPKGCPGRKSQAQYWYAYRDINLYICMNIYKCRHTQEWDNTDMRMDGSWSKRENGAQWKER